MFDVFRVPESTPTSAPLMHCCPEKRGRGMTVLRGVISGVISRVSLGAVFGGMLIAPASIAAQSSTANRADRETAAVRAQLLARIAAVPGAQVGIAVQDLASGRRLSIDGDSLFHAASTMKVPVMFALFQQFQAGTLQPTQTVRLQNRFKSIVDQSAYSLDASDDSDSTVYALVGTDVTLHDLAVRMITHSSNLATNALIEQLNAEKITALTRTFGATHMMVRRGVEDNLAFQAGLNNTTTANDLVALFVALQQGRVAKTAGTNDMLAILEAQAFNDEIPAGLPPGTRIAHKTGSITATLHDAGLVYPVNRKPYAIAVLTRGIADQNVAKQLIADCSRMIWTWLASTPAAK